VGVDPPTPGAPERAERIEPLAADEVRSRATSGAAFLGARNALIYALGVVANLTLARLLAPRDFGVVTIGLVVVVLGTYIGEAGVGAALIRRERPPTHAELQAVNALQLAMTTALALVASAIAAQLGHDGLVVATMAASLPIAVLRSPSVIVLERELRYETIATADVVEAVSYYAWAVGSVALGLGVWGLASAVAVRALVGTATMLAIGPLGLIRPRWSWREVRPVMGFGAKFQATALLQILRDYGLNIVVAAVAGLSTLGVWNLAWRVLQVPNLLFMTVGRVAFPAVSRLLGAGRDPRSAIERGVAALAAMTGIVAVGLISIAPALPAIVGAGWSEVPSVLLWSGIALIVGVPIAFATSGYLFAADDAGAVAAAAVLSMVAWFGVTGALLPRYGAPAAGIGFVASSIVNAGVLWRRTTARSGAAIGARIAGPTAVALAAAALGWLVAHRVDPRPLGAALGFVVGEGVMVFGLALSSRKALADLRSLVAQALGSLRTRSAPARA
jgi:O-antigen/teichoic acid export membrane protein